MVFNARCNSPGLLSRVVMEVALYPLVVVGFLLALRRASERQQWTTTDILLLAITLATLTYTYSIGRLLGPLLAFGLIIFVTRSSWRSVVLTWLAYAVTLVPIFIFQWRNPTALTARFNVVSFVGPESGGREILSRFVRQYLANLNPWRMFGDEHSEVSQIIHIPHTQPMLIITAGLLIVSLVWIWRRHRMDRWWWFIVYGLAVAVVPASLTNEQFHMLRLAALPVFLLVLTIPALEWQTTQSPPRWPVALLLLLAITLIQGSWFQYRYRAEGHSARRLHLFDADYTGKILPAALANSAGRIYCTDAPPIWSDSWCYPRTWLRLRTRQ